MHPMKGTSPFFDRVNIAMGSSDRFLMNTTMLVLCVLVKPSIYNRVSLALIEEIKGEVFLLGPEEWRDGEQAVPRRSPLSFQRCGFVPRQAKLKDKENISQQNEQLLNNRERFSGLINVLYRDHPS